MKNQRVKIVRLDANLIVDVLNWWRNPPDFLALPVCEELPSDIEVLAVNANWAARAIEVIVSHPTFPVVESHVIPPVVPGIVTEFRHVSFDSVMKERTDGTP